MKVESVRTVSFLGDCENLKRELLFPFSSARNDNSFFYKSSLYRIENVEDSTIRVVVFSACDLIFNMEELLILSSYPKTVIYLTDCHRLKRLGIKLKKKNLSYLLPCPIVFDTPFSPRGINKLLTLLHIMSSTPSFETSKFELCLAKKSIFSFRERFTQKIYNKIIKFGKNI